VDAATKNIRWALTQQTPSGWFKTNSFKENGLPFTHNIAYAIRGILESGLLLDNEEMINAAIKAATAQAAQQEPTVGYLELIPTTGLLKPTIAAWPV